MASEATKRGDIKKMAPNHMQILEWVLLNPERTQADCAAHFGMTQGWMSRIINSDAFQAAYREHAAASQVATLHTIHNQLAGLTSQAVEKASNMLETAPSEKFVHDVLKTSLNSSGFGPKQAEQVHNHQHVHVSAERLADARNRAEERRRGTTSQKAIDHAEPEGQREASASFIPAPAAGGGRA